MALDELRRPAPATSPTLTVRSARWEVDVLPGTGGALAQLGAQIGGGMVLLKYSRTDESQADAVGARLMYDTGYDPRQMALFFEKLKAAGGGGGVGR